MGLFRTFTVLVTACASLLLGGCWISRDLFLEESQAERPFESGVYVSAGGMKRRLWTEGRGWYRVEDLDKENRVTGTRRMLINAMPELNEGGRTVYAFAVTDSDAKWIYGLLILQYGQTYEIHPDCDFEGDQRLATARGAKFSDEGIGSICRFDRASDMRAALGDYYRAKRGNFGAGWRRNNW